MKQTGRKQEMCTKLHWKASKKETNTGGDCSSNVTHLLLEDRIKPIPVAAKSEVWVCGCSLAGIAVSNPAWKMESLSCEWWVFLDRSLCVGLITRPEESYRVWSVRVCLWSLDNEVALAQWGLWRHKERRRRNITDFCDSDYVIFLCGKNEHCIEC
jgi:hypothetical protein